MAQEMTEESKEGSKSDWYGDKDKGSTGNTGMANTMAKARAKSDIATIAES